MFSRTFDPIICGHISKEGEGRGQKNENKNLILKVVWQICSVITIIDVSSFEFSKKKKKKKICKVNIFNLARQIGKNFDLPNSTEQYLSVKPSCKSICFNMRLGIFKYDVSHYIFVFGPVCFWQAKFHKLMSKSVKHTVHPFFFIHK